MDIIMGHVAAAAAIQLGNALLTDLNYADDVALLVERPEQLQNTRYLRWRRKLRSLICMLPRKRLKFKILAMIPWQHQPLYVGNETVEAVTSFCYLGSTLTSDANSWPDVFRRIDIASTAQSPRQSMASIDIFIHHKMIVEKKIQSKKIKKKTTTKYNYYYYYPVLLLLLLFIHRLLLTCPLAMLYNLIEASLLATATVDPKSQHYSIAETWTDMGVARGRHGVLTS